MRITDWSSGVCYSVLLGKLPGRGDVAAVLVRIGIADHHFLIPARGGDRGDLGQREPVGHHLRRGLQIGDRLEQRHRHDIGFWGLARPVEPGFEQQQIDRSEEHTSELQSLMRISYAVFCLKKKNKKTNKQYREQKLT